MLRLRLEVIPTENLSDICNQATRIATHLGIEVVFKYLEQDFTAKPGMSAESCLNELLNKCEMPATITHEDTNRVIMGLPPKNTEPKATGKKGGKLKDQAPGVTPEATQPDVQKEGI